VNNKSKETRFEFKELDLGERRVSRMNFSYIVTLPKIFVQNTANGKIITLVRITMLEDGCLKLTPVREKDEPADFVVM
jgi:hypothetical protein